MMMMIPLSLGDFGGGDNDDDDVGSPEVNIPNEEAQGPNNFATDGKVVAGLPEPRRPLKG